MRAATITAHGRAPEVLDRPEPVPGDGDLVVAVTAVPITPLDLLCATGTSYFGPPVLPYVPGVQGVGVVHGGPTDLVGRRVWFPTTAGMAPGDGSMAERAVVTRSEVVCVPDELGDVEAAALGLSAVAAWQVLTARAGLRRGEQVLVLGAGGAVGQVAVQAARILGARRVVALCRSQEARLRAQRAGADAVVGLEGGEDATTLAERVRAQCDGPVDVVVDPVAGVPGSAAALLLAEGGRLVNLGSSAGPSVSVDSAVLRSRSASVLGYTNTSLGVRERADAMEEVYGHAAAGDLRVDHEAVPLDEAPAAWGRVAGGRSAPRVVVTI